VNHPDLSEPGRGTGACLERSLGESVLTLIDEANDRGAVFVGQVRELGDKHTAALALPATIRPTPIGGDGELLARVRLNWV
jgi:hypothetical protein